MNSIGCSKRVLVVGEFTNRCYLTLSHIKNGVEFTFSTFTLFSKNTYQEFKIS